MDMLTCKIDNQGRVMLPARWRREHGLGPGSEVVVTPEEGRIILETLDEAVAEAQRIVRERTGPRRRSAVAELIAGRRREARREQAEARARR